MCPFQRGIEAEEGPSTIRVMIVSGYSLVSSMPAFIGRVLANWEMMVSERVIVHQFQPQPAGRAACCWINDSRCSMPPVPSIVRRLRFRRMKLIAFVTGCGME